MKKYSDEISQSISTLSGVGVKTKSLLSEIGINSLFDLLSMPPIELIDKKAKHTILSQLEIGKTLTFKISH